MDFIEGLRELGVDIEDALYRLRGNQDLFKELILGIPEDVADYDVGTCLQNGDYYNAALHAHALKGEMANLGVTPLYNWYASLNTLIKEDKIEDAKKVYAEGSSMLNRFLEFVDKYQDAE